MTNFTTRTGVRTGRAVPKSIFVEAKKRGLSIDAPTGGPSSLWKKEAHNYFKPNTVLVSPDMVAWLLNE